MFIRDNIFRIRNVDGIPRSHEPHIDICVEFFKSSSCPCLKLWVEKHHPPRYDHQTEEWIDERMEITATLQIYGRSLLDDEPRAERVWSAWWVAEALANGSVSGKDASNLAHHVVSQWVIRAPEELTKEIAEAAPGWWGRISHPS